MPLNMYIHKACLHMLACRYYVVVSIKGNCESRSFKSSFANIQTHIHTYIDSIYTYMRVSR